MEALDLNTLPQIRKESRFADLLTETHANICFTCGTCSSGCPLTFMDCLKEENIDCRKAIRMILLGMEQELIDSKWVWSCSACYRCVYGCPMGVHLTDLWYRAKSLRPRDKVPGVLQKGVDNNVETGNNMRIPEEDYVMLLEELGEELAEEECPGFVTPYDVEGAEYLFFENSKEVYAEPDDMKWWWKIFYAAKASWTTVSKNWESVDWGIFTCDFPASKEFARRRVEHMKNLNIKTMILPDCGGSSWGTRYNLEKYFKHEFGPETGRNYVYLFDVLLKFLREGLIKVDKSVHAGRIVTYHDSCKHGRAARLTFGDDRFEEAREILSYCIDMDNFVEMPHNRMDAYCCGAGAGNWPGPYEDVRTEHGWFKAQDIIATGADLVICACSNCRDNIMKNIKKKFNLEYEVKYIWEMVADALILDTEEAE
ncbi:MAG: Fe-S oxidoreductase [Desulfobacca sp. 4484_104]|nr:MAG: Fe-S oxidoreductase [Desulfobacca sp. 4484_104]RLA87636.1 MAG: (Fe-S)-binding protein [Deltaproteobacteria bacterium]